MAGSCRECGARLPKDVGEWCPACGASLTPDDGAWELRVERGGPRRRVAGIRGSLAWFVDRLPRRSLTAGGLSRRSRALLAGGVIVLVAAAGVGIYFSTESRWAPGGEEAGGYPELFPVFVDGRWGYIDSTGTQVVEPRFADAQGFSEGLGLVAGGPVGASFGFVDSTGRVVVEPGYTLAEGFSEGLALVVENGVWTFIDETGDPVISLPEYVEVRSFSQGLAAVALWDGVKALWGYVDRNGAIAIPPQFGAAEPFSEGLAAVQTGRGWGYINQDGKMLIEPEFGYAGPFSEGLASVWRLGQGTSTPKYGYVDKNGAMAIEARFDAAGDFHEGLAWVLLRDNAEETGEADALGEWGYIDKNGEVVIGPSFLATLDFSEGLAAVNVKGRWGYVDVTGEFVVEPRFGWAEPFTPGGLARVSDVFPAPWLDVLWESTVIYIDKTGAVVWQGSEGAQGEREEVQLFPASVSGAWGYVDADGEWVIEPVFAEARDFSEGLAVVSALDAPQSYGYVDMRGAWVIPPQFNSARDLSEGLAVVVDSGVWTIIDGAGRVIAELPEYSYVRDFSDGLAAVTKADGLWGYVNAQGRLVIARQFRHAESFSEGLAAVQPDDLWGYIDKTGAFAIEPRFTSVRPFSQGLAAVQHRSDGEAPNVYIDPAGEIAFISPSLWRRDFHEGLAAVGVTGVEGSDRVRYGYIDMAGEWVIQPAYEWVDDFSEGLAVVQLNGAMGYIDQTGTLVIAAEFRRASAFSGGIALVEHSPVTFRDGDSTPLSGDAAMLDPAGAESTGGQGTSTQSYIDRTGAVVYRFIDWGQAAM